MEERVREMEAELRVLREMVSALVPTVAARVARELKARGAVLVVQMQEDETARMVEQALTDELADKEDAKGCVLPAASLRAGPCKLDGDASESAVANEDADQDGQDEDTVDSDDGGMVDHGDEEDTTKEVKGVESKRTDATESSGDEREGNDEQNTDGSKYLDSSETTEQSVGHRAEVQTSQESAGTSSSDEIATSIQPLSLSAFDNFASFKTGTAIKRPAKLPHLITPPKSSQQSATPLRPLVLRQNPSDPPSAAAVCSAQMAKPSAEVLTVPADFEVQTRDSLMAAWEKWCCGEPSRGFPPFRQVTSKQVQNKAMHRRLCDLRCTMNVIETLAKESRLWITDQPTAHQAAAIFTALQPQLVMFELASGRSRKKEITWSTALNTMRRGKKRRQEEMQAGETPI